jgi:hypothetical protein
MLQALNSWQLSDSSRVVICWDWCSSNNSKLIFIQQASLSHHHAATYIQLQGNEHAQSSNQPQWCSDVQPSVYSTLFTQIVLAGWSKQATNKIWMVRPHSGYICSLNIRKPLTIIISRQLITCSTHMSYRLPLHLPQTVSRCLMQERAGWLVWRVLVIFASHHLQIHCWPVVWILKSILHKGLPHIYSVVWYWRTQQLMIQFYLELYAVMIWFNKVWLCWVVCLSKSRGMILFCCIHSMCTHTCQQSIKCDVIEICCRTYYISF